MTRLELPEIPERGRLSIPQRIRQFLMANSHRYWTDLEIEQRLQCASVRRRRQQIFELDRLRPPAEREFHEIEVPNATGRGRHLAYRYVPEAQRGRPWQADIFGG